MWKKKGKDNDSDAGDIEISGVAKNGNSLVEKEKDVAIENDEEENFNDETESERALDAGTWPADCYSFIAIHNPVKKPIFFGFGFCVWSFQMAFLILLVFYVVVNSSKSGDNDNPADGVLASFIPAKVGSVSRATQFFALLSYCIFADESLKDIVTAVETWPKAKKARDGYNIYLMRLSCTMRFTQGMLASLVVFVLVVTTPDVIDIILNFTAVNFISGFDDVAFELAQWGKYGPRLEKEANRIEELKAPPCIYRKYQHVRYLWTVLPMGFVLLVLLSAVAFSQASPDVWLTNRLRVQFQDNTSFEGYSGCYDIDPKSINNPVTQGRVIYNSFQANDQVATFGYCDGKWFLYEYGDFQKPCDVPDEHKLAFSSKTDAFDIGTSFEDGWTSSSGTPLELFFFDNEGDLTDNQCNSFLGDGVCNDAFNSPGYDFDAGDCCAPTCGETNCGVGTLKNVFGVDVAHGDGYQNCIDPKMKDITIRFDNVYLPEKFGEPIVTFEPQNPLMILDCDGKNLLTLIVDEAMVNNTETVRVDDGANCSLMIKNSTSGSSDIYFVEYTIYHGDEETQKMDPLVIARGNSNANEMNYFYRLPDCFMEKLENYTDNTIYTGTGPSHQAIDWLARDADGFSSCSRQDFVERYALAAINFAAPVVPPPAETENGTAVDHNGLWISEERQCAWKMVTCVNGRVSELELGRSTLLAGTLATEIGILKDLTKLDMSENMIIGTIPPEIGQMKNLKSIDLKNNQLTGTIPTEIVKLTNLESIDLSTNGFNGTFFTFFTEMPSLKFIRMYTNSFSGSLPDEIGSMSNVEVIRFDGTGLTGTIPSVYGDLTELLELGLSYNELSGTIPSELAQLKNVQEFDLKYNQLTGSISQELLDVKPNINNFDIYANQLSGLTPIEGEVICSAEGFGDHYCDCTGDCSFAENRCRCSEAQACCAEYFSQFEACVVCKDSGLQNPNFYLKDFMTTCEGAQWYISSSLAEFGNPENCTIAEFVFSSVGCRCNGVDLALP